MIVTPNTKYRDFEHIERVAESESLENLKSAAQAHYKAYNMLTIDEFFGVCAGDYSVLGDMAEPSVLQVYWLKGFADFADAFKTACEQTSLHPTIEQEQAAKGTIDLTPIEGILTFLQEYFRDRSFFESGKHTIGEYLLARKVHYNKQLTTRNYENIQRNKLKR